jgi:argininosuccinate synthase
MFGGPRSALIGAPQPAPTELIGAMPEGGAEAIASGGPADRPGPWGNTAPGDELLDHAAMESGTD